MLGSSGHLNPDSGTKGSTSSDNGVESVELQTETEPLALEVQQNDGYGNVEVFPNRKRRFRWLLRWNRAEASTQSIRRLIGHVETGPITIFKFSQLAASTNNFSSLNIIGTGGFGTVFKLIRKLSYGGDNIHVGEGKDDVPMAEEESIEFCDSRMRHEAGGLNPRHKRDLIFFFAYLL
ncbi:hypothetical protein PR202_gb13682 [Eleusine coracana subsp. coracana]|uniref:Protein kinase domain-containing protein n=1 Tax=Eleusine coracana subsp. coracana TaxID=191504 RepID=A0AAV5ETG3_ELECO|nr:hypothetical protein PR202_gb13682 [Eleusine coracana subsp. coracana]